ncbi:MAG: glycosyltransferase [Okeania sp. SIO3I5]|uniref:glycosyltransferase n=1 Tax=Okeania sp. SIO3I5 TaxID=2607805 RepID=UPI0013B7BB8D|nr:glycosyltransferase [Okeania sp. SIO3I5]NEQ40060.1 glycosyltransferase [Okeania sp. SIO3I5]
MTTSNITKKYIKGRLNNLIFVKFRLATLLLIGGVTLLTIIVVAWLAGIGQVDEFFTQIHYFQENPPLWVQVPTDNSKYLVLPTILLFLIAQGIMKISPTPKNWSRVFVVGILLGLTIRYLSWRSLSTLNLNNPINGIFSLGLLGLEIVTISSSVLGLFLMFKVKNRQPEADYFSQAILDKTFEPSVDILIPTYNEAEFILERTVIGCQALEYNNKKVYLLDDTNRENVKNLAEKLGCEYITRYDNSYAKAGNLNHAITKTNGEFIVVFDADFIPTKNFLTRTLGFFQNEQVALVQTPQTFYNIDPIAKNLGLENILTPEEETFYRQIQPMKDGADGVLCAGTSFLVRRKALESVGGFVTESICEDCFTGVLLSAKGYQSVYLEEKLSAGLAAENISCYATQRLRWARGTFQGFFINSNPLTIPGLSFGQRLAYLETFLSWLTSISYVGFLFMPLTYVFFDTIPIKASAAEYLYFFLPYYLASFNVFSWLNYRSQSLLLSGLNHTILAFPKAITIIQTLLNPFSKRFRVTPKGIKSDRYYFNMNLALPLVIFLVLNSLSLLFNLYNNYINQSWEVSEQIESFNLGLFWSGYNILMIWVALLGLIDVPKQDIYEWFNLRRIVKLKICNQTFWGTTRQISEVGAEIEINQKIPSNLVGKNLPVRFKILEEKICLVGKIIHIDMSGEFPCIKVRFEEVNLSEKRQLIELLFCRPWQWQRREIPGELQSLWLLLRVFLKPRFIFERKPKQKAMEVSQL